MESRLYDIGLEYPLITLISAILLLGLYLYFFTHGNYGIKLKYDDILAKIYKKNTLKHIFFQVWICIILIVYSIVFGLPYISDTTEKIEREGNDIVFVFDVSYSMIARDIQPTRLDAAREMFLKLTRELGNNRLGLVLYAGQAFQSVPLSFDREFMLQAVADINIESLPQTRVREFQGTAIGDGLLMAREAFDMSDTSREKIIILMTDGEENRGVASRLTIPRLIEDDIKVFTIAFGKDDDAVIELRNPMGFTERLAVGGIDEALLREIARETKGEYFRATDSGTISEIIERLSELSTLIVEIEVFQLKKYLIREVLALLIILQLGLVLFYFTQRIHY